MDDTNRREFLRRTGALGIAGAAALGYPLIETRAAGSAPLLPPRDVIAAGGGATVKIGHIDGFSGVYASASASQQHGLEVAVAQAMKKNSRIKYEIVKGDDANTPATGSTEARRLLVQEKVDVLTGCLSSGVGLAVSNTAEELGSFFLAIGTHDTNITGQGAHHVTYRQTCTNAMLANAIGPRAAQVRQEVVLHHRRLRVRQRRAGAAPKDLARPGRPGRRERQTRARRDRLLLVHDQGAQYRRQRHGLLQLRTRHAERGQGRPPARRQQEDEIRRDPVRQRRRGRASGRRHRRIDLGLRVGTGSPRRRAPRRSTKRSRRASKTSIGACTSA